MLAGEYAVLQGHTALACTVDARIQATIEPAAKSSLSSDLWDAPIDLAADAVNEEQQPLVSYVKQCRTDGQAFHLRVTSEFPVTYGIGSSSAVGLASTAAINHFFDDHDDWLPAKVHQTQRQWQKRASGYDIATQYSGGVVFFKNAVISTWPVS